MISWSMVETKWDHYDEDRVLSDNTQVKIGHWNCPPESQNLILFS